LRSQSCTNTKKQKTIQRKLAVKMQLLGFDVDHYFIRRVENGERFVTDIDLVIFARALGVPITELLKEDDLGI